MKKKRINCKKDFREKRKADRLDINMQVKYHVLPRKKILEETFSQNVSGNGLQLKVNYPLKKDDRLKTFLYFPNDPKPIRAISKIIWCKKVISKKKKPHFNIGVKHEKILTKDKTRFIFLFCEMMIDYFLIKREKVTVKLR